MPKQQKTDTKISPPPNWRADQPFNALPELPPAVELETRAVLKACITARAAVAELKQAAQPIPNQAMLVNTLPMLESQGREKLFVHPKLLNLLTKKNNKFKPYPSAGQNE